MIYNSENKIEAQQSEIRLKWLIDNKKTYDITVKHKKRTYTQNRYLHLILSFFALEYGETKEYTKQDIFKKKVNKDIFEYERTNPKTGEKRKDYRSTSILDTKEMTDSIEKFRNWSNKEAGIYIPSPNEKEFLNHIENEIEKHKQWL